MYETTDFAFTLLFMSSRIPQTPPVIPPVAEPDRPLWSVMIPTYNCFAFIEPALKSVLNQLDSETSMQIEVVDDGSTDGDVEALVQKVGGGRVSFFRQENNVGSLRNFETCLNRAKGQWVHLLHGDDMVKEGFYKEVEHLFTRFPEAGAAIVKNSYINEKGFEKNMEREIIDEPGIIPNWLETIALTQRLQPPAIVVKREVYEKLGGFFAVHYGEDWEMYTRIAAAYPVVYTPKYLAMYRVHSNNITSNAYVTGQHIKDLKKVIDIIQSYLPPSKREKIKSATLKAKSIWFARHAHAVYPKNPKIALQHAKNAIRLHTNPITVALASLLYVKYLAQRQWLKK